MGNVVINQVNHANLLIHLDDIAKQIGVSDDSAKYYEEISHLAEDVINKMVEIWEKL